MRCNLLHRCHKIGILAVNCIEVDKEFLFVDFRFFRRTKLRPYHHKYNENVIKIHSVLFWIVEINNQKNILSIFCKTQVVNGIWFTIID
jgi:hypothetical protein